MSHQQELKGLGGWLILVGIGLVISPIKLLFELIPMYKGFINDGAWAFLTSPDSPMYHPFWAPFIIVESFINFSIVLISIYLIYLYFAKKITFPKIYIGMMIFLVLFLFVDALLIQIVMPNEPLFDQESGLDFLKVVIGTSIWVPYMLMSKRVKATFINP